MLPLSCDVTGPADNAARFPSIILLQGTLGSFHVFPAISSRQWEGQCKLCGKLRVGRDRIPDMRALPGALRGSRATSCRPQTPCSLFPLSEHSNTPPPKPELYTSAASPSSCILACRFQNFKFTSSNTARSMAYVRWRPSPEHAARSMNLPSTFCGES